MLVTTELKASKKRFPDFAEIVNPLSRQMKQLDLFLEKEVEQFEPETQELVSYVFQHSGKRLRPLLVFLCGTQGWNSRKEDLVRAAAVVELVHLATLVHDDILDGADVRHRQATASQRYGADVAVLLGDALFAHALKLAADFPTPDVCRAVALATRKVCAGEIKQTFKRGDFAVSLEEYYRVIDLKTAELFRVSSWLGGMLSGSDQAASEAYAEFGRRLGVAYQIFDDVVDVLGEEDEIGKTLGTDLEMGKVTLPFILWQNRQPVRSLNGSNGHSNGNGTMTMEGLRRAFHDEGLATEVRRRFEEEVQGARGELAKLDGVQGHDRLCRLCDYIQSRFDKLLA